MLSRLPYGEVWAVDFEFAVKDGARPNPVCLVAWELRSGRKLKLWRSEFGSSPPHSVGPDSLFIAYYASAEIGCHLALKWPKPVRILDLFTEFRCRTNGLQTPTGSGLLGALAYYGLDGMASSEKDAMRELIFAVAIGPNKSVRRSFPIAKKMWQRWPGCSFQCSAT